MTGKLQPSTFIRDLGEMQCNKNRVCLLTGLRSAELCKGAQENQVPCAKLQGETGQHQHVQLQDLRDQRLSATSVSQRP